MPDQLVIHDTFVIERSYPRSAARVFAAFSNAVAKRRWYAEGETRTIETFDMDFRVGGTERFVCRLTDATPFPGLEIENDGRYLDIVPDQRIVSVASMTLGGKRISAAMVTIELVPAGVGTTLICTHYAVYFEGSDGPQMRRGGWEALFVNLEKELERE
jgi:uncharacterized protein YndB with AHSA1/START domain